MSLPADFAVYAEHSDRLLKVEGGWNPRIFNRTEVEEGASIRFDAEAGVLRLGPGVYHITGSSQVTYDDLDPDPPTPGWNTEPRPNGGYSRLRYAADADCKNEKAIVVGTISNANMLPSLIETYLDVPTYAELVYEHQVGFGTIEGIYLEDDATGSTWHVFARIAIRKVGESASSHAKSALCSAFDAAFKVYLADPEPYRRLFASYLGVVPKFVPTVDGGAWPTPGETALARALRSGVLRFGYSEGAPYVFHGENGELCGIDWELGNALTAILREQYFHFAPGKGLRAEWVTVEVGEGGDPEELKFEALHDGLRRGLFDIAMSGQANLGAGLGTSDATRSVDWSATTALLFTNILYTGRDGHDLSGLVGATRERFIERVKGWDEVIVMCVANPGPSPINSAALVAAINQAGGRATLRDDGTLPTIQAAIAEQTIHFSVGDSVASAWIGNQPGLLGLNLDIAAGTQPLQTAQPVAAFTLREGG